jgi:DNA-binding ferritin-like protein
MYAATLRIAPVQRGSVRGLSIHNTRTEEYARKTEHIDPERVKENRVLAGTSDPGQDLLKSIEGIPMARKGKKETEEYVGAEIIMTARAEYFQGITPEVFKDWQERNLAWLRQEFDQAGRGCLVSAVLHMDEEAPHIHAVIAPVIQKSRIHPVTKEPMPAKAVLNYSAIFGDRIEVLAKARKEGRSHLDTQLGRLQTRYGQAMEPCGLIRGRESMRSKTPDVKYVAPHVYRLVKGQIDALEQESAQAQEKLEQTQAELTDQKKQLQKQLRALACDGHRITADEVKPRVLKKNLFSSIEESFDNIAERLNQKYIAPLLRKAIEGNEVVPLQNSLKSAQSAYAAIQEQQNETLANLREFTDGLTPEQIRTVKNMVQRERLSNSLAAKIPRTRQ